MDEELFEAARAVRPYLDDLVPDRAEFLDSQVGALLEREHADRAGAVAGLAELFSSEPDLRDWIAALLADPQLRPPDVAQADEPAATKSYQSLAGDQQPVPAARYACPRGERVWYRRSQGQPVPRCPEHDLAFVPAPRVTP
jgi:hypothetical protein